MTFGFLFIPFYINFAFILIMSFMPLITIITVTFNAEKVIGKTLSSLSGQTFSDFEHLVIDGNSTDHTLDILKKSALPSTKWISEPDKGLYDAMNKGLRMAKGKYVLFLNAGDSFHDATTLESYAEEALQNKDIIYGDTLIVNHEGSCLGPRHLSVPEFLTRKSFADGMLICHQAFMVKKELAPQFDLRYRFSSDYDWCVKCIQNSVSENCANLNRITIDYLSDGLTDKNKFPSLKERFRIMSHHYGLPVTVLKHLSFIFRAFKRGKI